MTDAIFLSIDVEEIKEILLSIHRPPNQVIWHYSINGELTVVVLITLIRNGNIRLMHEVALRVYKTREGPSGNSICHRG